MRRADLQMLMPSVDWNQYFERIGRPDADSLNVTQPKFFKQWQRELGKESLDNLKSYLRWQVTRAEAPYLSADFVQADFEFYSRTLRGVERILPRWKRCVSVVDPWLGGVLGQESADRQRLLRSAT